jgi:hypothetical protein
MKVSKDDMEKRQLLDERAAILECLQVVKAGREHHKNLTTLYNITDGGSAVPRSHTSNALSRSYTIEWILEFTAERLGSLLHIWEDCPGQTREILASGVPQLKKMSTGAVNYKRIRYPCMFFGFMCDANICLLEQGESIEPSILLTAWNGFQLPVQIVNE